MAIHYTTDTNDTYSYYNLPSINNNWYISNGNISNISNYIYTYISDITINIYLYLLIYQVPSIVLIIHILVYIFYYILYYILNYYSNNTHINRIVFYYHDCGTSCPPQSATDQDLTPIPLGCPSRSRFHPMRSQDIT